MVVWSVLVLAVVVLAKAAVPDPPDIGVHNTARPSAYPVPDCTDIVAFSASYGTIRNNKIVHTQILVDKGYTTQDGIFYTHCPGLYQISFAGYGSTDLKISLKRRLARTTRWDTVTQVGPGGGANTVLLNLNVGDQLAVVLDSGTVTTDSTFTGYRIHSKK